MTLATAIVVRTRRFLHQQKLISAQQAELKEVHELLTDIARASSYEMYRMRLSHIREIEGIIAGWLISLERPEDDDGLRLELAELESKLKYQIAKIEEHFLG